MKSRMKKSKLGFANEGNYWQNYDVKDTKGNYIVDHQNRGKFVKLKTIVRCQAVEIISTGSIVH